MKSQTKDQTGAASRVRTGARTKAIFPGSFDPFTLGHMDIVRRASKIFDHVVIAVSSSNSKVYALGEDQRVRLIKAEIKGLTNVSVVCNKGLTVAVAEQNNARFLIRALRSGADFDFERSIAEANTKLNKNIETVFLISKPELSCVSSSLVREIAKNNGDLSLFVSASVEKVIRKAMK